MRREARSYVTRKASGLRRAHVAALHPGKRGVDESMHGLAVRDVLRTGARGGYGQTAAHSGAWRTSNRLPRTGPCAAKGYRSNVSSFAVPLCGGAELGVSGLGRDVEVVSATRLRWGRAEVSRNSVSGNLVASRPARTGLDATDPRPTRVSTTC